MNLPTRVLRLEGTPETFEREAFLSSLSELLDISSEEIEIVSVKRGSILVEVRWAASPRGAARVLIRAGARCLRRHGPDDLRGAQGERRRARRAARGAGARGGRPVGRRVREVARDGGDGAVARAGRRRRRRRAVPRDGHARPVRPSRGGHAGAERPAVA